MDKKRIAMMSCHATPWKNFELAKDCGIVPYLLMKNHGCETFMVCGKGNDYPYLELMQGFSVVLLQDNTIESKVKYLHENGDSLNAVLFYGVTSDNIQMVETIKRVNPKCVLGCALDMNADFADSIPFYEQPFYDFFNSMDLMWQSDMKMTEFLNAKWYWDVICERNGYYNLQLGTSDVEYYTFEKRENTFLYVGRINNEIKNVGMLVSAFANIAEAVPDWNLKIVGPVEESFYEYMDFFFGYYPELADRVEFTGNIEDRIELHNEYEKAKIFCSASRMEGGVPNAMVEAICTGCVIATTKISAYQDATGNNEYGRCVELDDEKGFSDMLLELVTKCDLPEMSLKAYNAGKSAFNMEKIVGEIYGKLCDKGL